MCRQLNLESWNGTVDNSSEPIVKFQQYLNRNAQTRPQQNRARLDQSQQRYAKSEYARE